jgi:hypothetical protein
MNYDPIKAKALFGEHIKAAWRYNRHFATGDPCWGELFSDDPDFRYPTHYVITPEMLRAIRCHMSAYNQPHQLAGAIHSYLLDLDDDWYERGWEAQIAPDPPKPAWRVAADKARDEGLEFSAVLDAIQATLEEK